VIRGVASVADWEQLEEALAGTPSVPEVLAALACVPVLSEHARGWQQAWTRLQKPPAPRVVWTGDAKAGRSTLLNAVLGRPLLHVAVRPCTPVAVTVFAGGWRLTEVPPQVPHEPADGRVLVVDVRQPLPRRARVVSDGGGPTVLVLTKLDRARADAVLSSDVEAELDEAVDEAVRRARRRCTGPLVDVVRCDAREAEAVRDQLWPRIQAGLAGARERAALRGRAQRHHWLTQVVASVTPPEPMSWPPSVAVDGLARGIAQAAVTSALAGLALDRDAWLATLQPVQTHSALEGCLDRLEAVLRTALRSAMARAEDAVGRAWDAAVAGVRRELDAAWTDQVGVPASGSGPPARSPHVAPAFGVERLAAAHAARIRVAATGPVGALARLRRVSVRTEAAAAAWRTSLVEMETDLGAALWDGVVRWADALEAVCGDHGAWRESKDAAQRRTAEQRQVARRRALARVRVALGAVRSVEEGIESGGEGQDESGHG